MISAGYKSAYQQGYSDAKRDFRKEPKIAQWIVDPLKYGDDDIHCSFCGAIIERNEWLNHRFYYCYHCGTKMKNPLSPNCINGGSYE